MARSGDLYVLVNGFVEFAMTAFGIMVVLTPLALWVAWNEVVFFGTLATAGIGGAIFCLFSLLLHHLHRHAPEELDPEALRHGASYAEYMQTGRMTDWDALQQDDPESRRRQLSLRDGAMRDLRLVFYTASGLLALGGGMLVAAWTYAILRFGSGGE